ncbi:unnamed protein product, partial [marine sediment metagenome]
KTEITREEAAGLLQSNPNLKLSGTGGQTSEQLRQFIGGTDVQSGFLANPLRQGVITPTSLAEEQRLQGKLGDPNLKNVGTKQAPLFIPKGSAAEAQLAAPQVSIAGVKTDLSPLQSKTQAQAQQLGNTTLANKEYVNAVFKAYHNRDANAGELAEFTNKGVRDVFNAISGGVKPTTPDTTTISSESLGVEEPTGLPSVTPGVNVADGIVSGASQTSKTIQDFIKELTPTVETEAEKEEGELGGKITELLGQTGG